MGRRQFGVDKEGSTGHMWSERVSYRGLVEQHIGGRAARPAERKRGPTTWGGGQGGGKLSDQPPFPHQPGPPAPPLVMSTCAAPVY